MARAKKQPKVDLSVELPMLGALSNLFRGAPEEVAGLFRRYGLDSVQMLPSFPGIRFAKAEDVNSDRCRQMSQPFHEAELRIAGVSVHTNLLDPDAERRDRMQRRFAAFIEHCADFRTSYLITETGTLNPDQPWDHFPANHTTETFDLFIERIGPLVSLAESAGVTILLEGHLNHVVGSVERAVEVREQLGEHVGFVMDPVNYFTRKMAASSTKSLRTIFKQIGALAPIAHAKDVRYVGADLTTPRAGSGNLDYKEFLEQLSAHQPNCPLIFEQIRPEELRESIDFIDRFFHFDDA